MQVVLEVLMVLKVAMIVVILKVLEVLMVLKVAMIVVILKVLEVLMVLKVAMIVVILKVLEVLMVLKVAMKKKKKQALIVVDLNRKGKGRTRVELKKHRETRSSSHKKPTERQSPPKPVYPKNGSNSKPQYKNAVWVQKVKLDEKIPSHFKHSYFYYVYITDKNNDEQPKLQTPISEWYTPVGDNWTRIATKDAVGDGIKDNSNNIDDGSGGIVNFALEPYVNPNPKTIFTQGKLNESTEKNLNDQPSPKFAKTSQAMENDREKLLCRSIFPDITTAAKLLRDEFLIDHTNRLMFIVLTT